MLTGMMRRCACLWLLSCLVASLTLAADPAPPLPADSLAVRADDGGTVSFADLLGPDGRAVCFAFLHPACPLAQEYAPVLSALAADFGGAGIRFVGVVCDCDDLKEVDAYRGEYGIRFPIHLDTDFRLAETLDATITPEVVLVDRDRITRYSGRIDDRYKIRGVMTPGDAEPELANAIQDLLAGREIREPQTKAAGCPLDRPERPVGSPKASATNMHTPTFFKDVLPFLHTQCQKCHSPGQTGPFSLLSYDDAVEWVELGLEEIAARRMPPAQIDSDLDFEGQKPPTAAEVAMLREWVAAGKPEGNAADTPKLAPLPDSTVFQEDLGPPDIVLEQPELTSWALTATMSTATSCFRSIATRICGSARSSSCPATARWCTTLWSATCRGRRPSKPCGSMAAATASAIPMTGQAAFRIRTASGFACRPFATTGSRGLRS
jgi:peroxiredoxin